MEITVKMMCKKLSDRAFLEADLAFESTVENNSSYLTCIVRNTEGEWGQMPASPGPLNGGSAIITPSSSYGSTSVGMRRDCVGGGGCHRVTHRD